MKFFDLLNSLPKYKFAVTKPAHGVGGNNIP